MSMYLVFTFVLQWNPDFSKTSRGNANWFEKSGVQEIRGEITSEANPKETRFGSRYWEVQETEGSRNRDSTVLIIFIHYPVIRSS